MEGNNKRYWTYVDLEKAFDQVPREVAHWSLRREFLKKLNELSSICMMV